MKVFEKNSFNFFEFSECGFRVRGLEIQRSDTINFERSEKATPPSLSREGDGIDLKKTKLSKDKTIKVSSTTFPSFSAKKV